MLGLAHDLMSWVCIVLSIRVMAMAYLRAGSITMGVGAICLVCIAEAIQIISKSEGYLIVALGWLAMIGFGALPYLTTGVVSTVLLMPCSNLHPDSPLQVRPFLKTWKRLPKGLLTLEKSDTMDWWYGDHCSNSRNLPTCLALAVLNLFVAEAPWPYFRQNSPPHHSDRPASCGIYTLDSRALLIVLMHALGDDVV